MRAELIMLWFITASLCAAPRDPFQPAAQSLCEAPPAVLTGWRLQGVLGREPGLRARLVSPQNAVLTIAPTEPVALPGWQLSAIDRRSLTLRTRSGCAPQSTTFSLKGSVYAQDGSLSAGVYLPAARLRQGQR
ncbi:HofP DNA utilization family protein [Pantoea sp. KPR_PJ]|uniref:HofP DNA utilization family protein n=1 Tax=Pantoea sp. KPR_PJ TaxID=2738375 RepID=UPI003527CFE2